MSITSIGYATSPLGQAIKSLNNQMTTLSQQLATGEKSNNYAGMGLNESFAIAARSQLANISAFTDTISNVSTSIQSANNALQAISNLGGQVQSSAASTPQTLDSSGQTIAQENANAELSSMVGILNTPSGDRYLFSGNAIYTPATVPVDEMLNGTTTQAGLKTVMAERAQADGAVPGGTGRLLITNPLGDTDGSFGGGRCRRFAVRIETEPGDVVADGRHRDRTIGLAGRDLDRSRHHQSQLWRQDQLHLQSARRHHRVGAVDGNDDVASADRQLPDRKHACRDRGQPQHGAEYGDRHRGQYDVGRGVRDRGRRQLLQYRKRCDREYAHHQSGGAADRDHAATALSGSTGTDSLAPGFTAGDTITVNGTTLTFVNGTAGSGQISTTATVGDLLSAINSITGTSTPSTIDGGVVEIHTDDASSLSITSSPAGALARLGFSGSSITAPVPPLRVSGSPLSSATSLVAGTSANTVQWYTGNSGPGSARASSTARVNSAITVQYGAQANESAIRSQLQSIAVFAAFTVSPTGANSAAQISAISQRIATNLTPQPGQQTIADIQTDFARAQTVMKDTSARQAQTQTMLQTMVDNTETVSTQQVASEILALQTALQASYQTTSMMSQLTLTKYLPVG